MGRGMVGERGNFFYQSALFSRSHKKKTRKFFGSGESRGSGYSHPCTEYNIGSILHILHTIYYILVVAYIWTSIVYYKGTFALRCLIGTKLYNSLF
jgi:hypothetical protein